MRPTLLVLSLLACCALADRPVSAEEGKAKVAASFVSAWNQHDVPALLALIDARELAHRIGLASVDEAAARKLVEQEYRYRESLQDTAKLTRTTPHANQVLAMVRIDGKAPGNDYLELVLEPRASGSYQVVDWYDLARGTLLSKGTSLDSKAAAGDPDALRDLVGVAVFDADVRGEIARFETFLTTGKSQEALAAMWQLPIPIAESRNILLAGARLEKLAGNDTEYRRLMNTLAQKYRDDPTVAFYLVGYYVQEKQLDPLLRALAVLDRRIGPNSALYLIRADALWHSGVPDEAMWFAQEAVRVEPDLEFSWNMLAVRYVMLKDYSRAIWVYRAIQTRFGRKFDRSGFESNSQMADFAQSQAFDQWLPRGQAAPGAATTPQNLTPQVLGVSLTRVIETCDPHALGALIDTGALAMRVAKPTHEPPAHPFSPQYKDTLVRSLLRPLCEASPDVVRPSVKLMRTRREGSETHVLVRFYWGELGVDYLDFILEPDITGQYRVVDWNSLARGEMTSDFIRDTKQILLSPSDSSSELVDALDRVTSLYLNGQYPEAIDAMGDLPGVVQSSRAFLLMREQAALMARRKGDYDTMLNRLAEKYGSDPSMALQVFSYDIKENKFDAALGRVAVVEQSVGSDGVTNLMKANVASLSGAPDQAVSFASRAVEVEPDLRPAWDVLARDYVKGNSYSKAVDTYQSMQSRFNLHYTREIFLRDPDLAEFVQSAEFQRWLPQ